MKSISVVRVTGKRSHCIYLGVPVLLSFLFLLRKGSQSGWVIIEELARVNLLQVPSAI